MKRRTTVLVLLLVTQLLLVGVAVAGQLSARVTGDEIRLRVGPIDPIDPFRGAYVDLHYPGLEPDRRWRRADDGEGERLFVVLRREGDVWVADEWTRERPDGGTYLACDDGDWRQRCGIESLFLPQDEAERIQHDIDQSGAWAGEQRRRRSGYVAVVKVDRWGNAAVTGVEKE
jgi:uncharacterized membrane-anchored protein